MKIGSACATRQMDKNIGNHAMIRTLEEKGGTVIGLGSI